MTDLGNHLLKHFGPRDNIWGFAINWSSFDHRTIHGHFPRALLDVGDVFAWEMESGKAALFEVISLTWQSDPPDQFFGSARDLGYAEDNPHLLHPADHDILAVPSKVRGARVICALCNTDAQKWLVEHDDARMNIVVRAECHDARDRIELPYTKLRPGQKTVFVFQEQAP